MAATSANQVDVRLFGTLRSLHADAGLPTSFLFDVPAEGQSALQLATEIGLPADEIEGVFVNQSLNSLDVHIAPGDRVAFVPFGTPGPHRYTLGLYAAGKHRGVR